MSMKALDRKLIRGLWHVRAQALAVAVVIACGVAVLVMSLSTLEALTETTATYYARNRFADVFASAVRAPLRVAERIAALPGVQAVETRISRIATLDVAGFGQPVVGRLTSIPEAGQPVLNRLTLRNGRWIEPRRHEEVIVNEAFAEAHGLRPGDRIGAVINGHRRTLTIVGTALSPEFVYALAPGGLMPDDKRFAVVWMGREALESAYDLEGAFDDLSVSLLRGADPAPVMRAVDRLLAPYGGISAVARADQLSNWFVVNEITQLRTMSTVLPAIFLGVAAFLTYMVLARLIATERAEIGLLKAFGYGNGRIAWHYTKLVLAIAAVGVLLGSLVGVMFGLHNTRLYAEFFRFPLLIYRPSADSFVIGAAVTAGATLAGALAAVARAAALPPAEAMRPPTPVAYRRSGLSTFTVVRALDQPTRIAVREIGRWPIRSAFTALGIALAVGLLVMGLQWRDSIDAIAQSYFFTSQRQSMTIGLAEPEAMPVVQAFRHLPGVLAAEPMRIAGADFSVGTRTHRGALTGVPQDSLLQPIHDEASGRDLPVPPGGVVLASRLAEKLGVGVGDRVFVDVHEGRRPQVSLPVTGVFETLISMPAYMDLDALNRLLRERPSASYVNLLVDPHAEPALLAELTTLPRVSAIMLKQAALDSFYNTIGEHLLTYIGIFAGFAAALAFGVTYNSARIALSERGRELATLRVLGFRRTEISYILLAQVGLLIAGALPMGCLIGLGLTRLVARLLDTELYRLPLVIEPATYGWAIVLTLLAAAVSALLVRRRVDRLDLIRVLKTRE